MDLLVILELLDPKFAVIGWIGKKRKSERIGFRIGWSLPGCSGKEISLFLMSA